MATTTTTTNKPLNPRAQDLSPKGYNRANIFSGKALDFDGVNDKIDTSFAFVGTSASISFYLNWDNFGTDSVEFICEGEASSEFMVHLGGGAGTNGIRFGMVSAVFDSANAVQAGWNHYVLTTNNTTAALYINGRLFNSQAIVLSQANITQLGIGYRSNSSSFFLNGKLAGFKAFNTALTAAQVTDLYLNPEKITPDGVATSALKLWLPMMEGAGASAYDGSGNGNDGTINGATWTAGIGAPVAQTALVSWNKGVNLAAYSEQLDQWNTGSTVGAIVRTANVVSAPNGTTTADRLVFPAVASSQFAVVFAPFTAAATSYKGGLWLRGELGTEVVWVSFTKDGVSYNRLQCALTTSWQFFDLTATLTAGSDNFQFGVDTRDGSQTARPVQTIYSWGASLRPTSAGDAYIKTNATAQTSAVLVPEGLTAGASIFGTDIITPRNAFALNLDGASWGKVGANASTAFGTGPFTLEAWVKLRFVNTGSYANEIISLNDKDDYAVRTQNTGGISFLTSNVIAYSTSLNGDWAHIVALRETGGTTRLYLNGTQVASGTDNTSIPSANGTRIGTDDTENARTYKDQLANPRIYNRALTAAEVLRNYNADKAKFGL